MFVLTLGLIANAQTNKKQTHINQFGLPIITNYTVEMINAHSQNNYVVQDKRGFLYFANQDGVLEYDGAHWNLIRNPYTASLSVDSNNIVHVGNNDGTFGYLKPNDKGELVYVSLSDKVDVAAIGPLYKTYSIKDRTYYCSPTYIVETVGDSIADVVALPENSFFSYQKGDSILVGRQEKKLRMQVYYNHKFTDLVSDVIGGVYGMEQYEGNKYLALTCKEDGLIVFGTDTAFIYNPIHPFYKRLIADNITIPYHLTRIGDDFAISSVQADVYTLTIFDKEFTPLFVLNNGLGFPSIHAPASVATGHVLWSSTYEGISKSEVESAIHVFGAESELRNVCDMIEYQGKLYVAASTGLFWRNYDEDDITRFSKVTKEQTNGLFEFKVPNSDRTLLLAATQFDLRIVAGVPELSSDNCKVSSKAKDIEFQKLFQPYKNNKQLIACQGGGGGVSIYEYRPKGEWAELAYFDEIQGAYMVYEDSNNNIWIGTLTSGVYRIVDGELKYTHYDENDGLPSSFQVGVGGVNGKALFYTQAGVYEFNDSTSKFELSNELGSITNDTTHAIWQLKPYRGGYAVANNIETKGQYWVSVYSKNADGEYVISEEDAIPLKKIPNKWYNMLYVDSDENIWVSTSSVLYCYRRDYVRGDVPYYRQSFDSHIRRVLTNDTILFGGAFTSDDGNSIVSKQSKDKRVVLPYRNNSLTFVYSSTFYEDEDKTEYSVFLEGDDKTWQKWTKQTEYTRRGLSEGRYVFKVKARNIYGVESSVAEYAFTIKPPFYRSIVAYIFYLALLVALVYGIVKWNTHRLIEEKKKLEQKIAEATEEIRGQNVQLEQQKDEIEKQKDEIQSSINYARRIQRALLTPDEIIDKIFPDHFLLYKPRNVVSGDYYWFGQFGDYKVSIVADCTGHGVPGGFMSMLGMTNLNYIVGQELRPDEILNKLRNAIITSLRQKDDTIQPTGDEKADRRAAFAAATEKKDRSQDGMDVAMYVLNEKEMTLSFAGANNPLVLIRDGEVEVVKASKMPVGIYAKLDPFERVDMEIKKGDCLYTFSDGFQDQFGYESGKKFMSKHLREVLLEIHQKPMAEQKEILNKIYEDWRGPADHQTDDVVLMGVRI